MPAGDIIFILATYDINSNLEISPDTEDLSISSDYEIIDFVESNNTYGEIFSIEKLDG